METFLAIGGIIGLILWLSRGGAEKTGASEDDKLFEDMMKAGAWIPIEPEKVSSKPSTKSGFTLGEDVYVALQKYGEGSIVVARLVVDELGGDEKSGPAARGKLVPLADKPEYVDVVQIEGAEKPAMGQVVAVPIAYRLSDDFLTDTGVSV